MATPEEISALYDAAPEPNARDVIGALYDAAPSPQGSTGEQWAYNDPLKAGVFQGAKNLITGAATMGELAGLFFNPVQPAIDMLFNVQRPSARQAVGELAKTLAPKVGVIVNEQGNAYEGKAADVLNAAMEGSVFPVGGPIVNAAAGAAAEVGHQLFPDSRLAPFLFALAPGAAKEGAIMGLRGLSPKVNAGKALLSEAGETGRANLQQALEQNATRGPAGALTYAEMADTPSAAAFQQTMRKIPGKPAETIEGALMERQAAREAGLQSVAPDALSGVEPMERGLAIQPPAAEKAKAAIDAANDLYRAVPDAEGIDILRAKFAVGTTEQNLFAKNPLPMDAEARTLLEAFRESPRYMTLSQLDGIRQAAGRVIGKLGRIDKKAPEIKLMEAIRGGIDDSIQRGITDQSAKWALEDARQARMFAGQKFQNPTVKGITKKGDYGQGFKMMPEKVIDRATGSATEAQNVVKAYGGDAAIMNQLRGGLIDRMAAQGTRNYQSWPKFFKQREGVFKEIFWNDASKVRAIMDDIASETRVQELASRASRGQSATAQYATAAKRFLEEGPARILKFAGNRKFGFPTTTALGAILGGLPLAGVGAASSATARVLTREMEKWVARGMADPEVLKLLAGRATANNVAEISKLFLGTLGAAAITQEPSRIFDSPVEIAGNGGKEKQGQQNSNAGSGYKAEIIEQSGKKLHGSNSTAAAESKQQNSGLGSLFKVPEASAEWLGAHGPIEVQREMEIGVMNLMRAGLSEQEAKKIIGAQAVAKYGNKKGMEKDKPTSVVDALIPAMIKAESAGISSAISEKGAMGILQIMPNTWREWTNKLGMGKADPFDPVANEKVARAYLSWLLKQFGDDPKLALAAYNWGIDNVKKALKGRTNISEIRAKLPAETKSYLVKILGKEALV